MTTAGVELAKEIIEAHSLKTVSITGEMMKALDRYTSKEELTTRMGEVGREDGIIDGIMSHDSDHLKEKFEIVYNWAKDHGKTLFWKQEVLTAMAHPDVMNFLPTINTKAFLFLRTNLVDVLLCRVTDFCDKEGNKDLGRPVDANGQEVSCGFRQRGDHEEERSSKINLNLTRVLGALEGSEQGDNTHQEYLKTHGFNYEVNSAEDLLAFEYGSDTKSAEFQTSMQAWTQLVMSLGITPQPDAIKKTLINFGKFSAPKRHTEMLYNFNDIKMKLDGTKYSKMLRE